MSDRITTLYNQYIAMPLANRIELSRRSYAQMEQEFKKAYDSWNGYNYAIDCALLICYMAGISETTYNLFLRTSGKSPSYTDFSNGACNCARNQNAIIRYVNIKHDDLIVAVSYYALTICACKGSLTDRDRNLINRFLTRG